MKHPTQRILWRITLCRCLLVCGLALCLSKVALAQEAEQPADPAKRVTAQKPVAQDIEVRPGEQQRQPKRRGEGTGRGNPFDLLRQLFRGNETPAPDADANENDDSDMSRAAHRKLRAGAPHDTETERQLRKAATLMEEGNWDLAMDLLQRQLDRSDDVSILLNDGNLVTARRQATRMLAEIPEEFRERYRLQYGDIAAQKLSAAIAANDLDEISEVANRYFHTPAGHEAANHVGTWHFDRGEFGMAALWFAQLLEARAKVAEDAKWRMKAALAYRQAGQLSDSEEILKEISSTGDAQLQLGGEEIDPNHWMLERGSPVTSIPPQLTEWPLFFGTPQRTGTATGGEPLLIPKWHEPLSHSHAIQQLTENLLDDLADQNMAPIPAWMPLMVDGKVIFRTLRGVLVVDAQTGRRLWETDVEQSPESALTGQAATQNAQDARQQMRFNANGLLNRYAYATAERHPLAGLLFANGTYGIISSDGEQLFVVEDHAVLSQQQVNSRIVARVDLNETSASATSNRVVAYDLSSGRPIWSVGGEKMNEPFDPPLAGFYFNGVPVREGEELFLVGEQSNEIRLFAVDPHTGAERWNQLVAIADEKIEADPFRRNWTSQVAVGEGVVVCPTTVGWLVGIDRLNHTALWAHRYRQPDLHAETERRSGSIADEQFNKRWCTSAPVISGNRVVFSPSEEPKLVCLDLFNGQVHWEKEKENFLYLAGVFGDCVLLVGSDSVAALSLKDGSNLWPPIQLSREDGPPTGVGVAVGEKYYLPLQDGQLWTIDLAKGAVVTRTYLPESEASLGNLAMYRGMLLSLNPLGVTSFEQRETVEKEIRDRKAVDPLDVPALLRESDLQLLARDYKATLETLKKVDRSRVPAESNARYLSSMRTALEAAIRGDLAGGADEVETLTSIAETEDQRLEARRLAAQRFLARKEHLAAFDVLWELAQTDASQFVVADETRVRLDAWLAGQFANLWRDLSDVERSELDGRLTRYAEQLPDSERAKRELFVLLFAFRPVAWHIEQQLVETYAKDGHFARAEQILLRRSAESDPAVAAAAIERLVRLTGEFNLAADADFYARRLEENFAQVKLPSGLTAGEHVAQLRREGTIGDADRPALADWKMNELKISRTGTAYNSQSPQPLDFEDSQLPSFQRYAFEVDQQRQRLTILDRTDDSVYWMEALRGGATSSREPVWAKAVGHRLIVQHRDIVHCISPVEREVLWTAPIDVRGRNNEFYRTATQRPAVSMRGGSAILSHSSILEQASHGGMTAIANNSYVCVHGRRQISVLDTETGAIRWTRTGIPQHSLVVGNSHTLFVVPPDRTESYALRASDGLRLDIADLGNILPRSIWLGDEGLLTIDVDSVREADGASDRETIARLFDPISNVEHWKRTWKGRTHLSLLDDGRLAVLDAKSQLELIEPQFGRGQVFEALPEELVKVRADMYVVADPQQVYLIVNRPRPRGEFHTAYYSQELPTIRVNGTLIALDVATGKKLWHRSIPAQGMIRSGLEQSPILLFTVRQSQTFKQTQYWRMNLFALDKRTGKPLLEEPTNGNYMFQALQVSASGRYVELITNNQHIRLSASSGSTAAIEAPMPPAEKEKILD